MSPDAASPQRVGTRDAEPEEAACVPLSVCVMACNDERVIARCLESVSWAAEIVVAVDSASRDATGDIARRLATRVEVHRYAGDIEQKRYVAGLARFAWILSIDSDEVVSDRLGAEIRALFVAGEPALVGYEVNRIAYHLGRWIRHGDWHPDWKLRLFAARAVRFEGDNPHGRAAVDGRVGRLPGALEHYSFRDLADQMQRIQVHTGQAADALFAKGRRARVLDVTVRPLARVLRSYVLRRGFLDGVPGLIVAGSIGFSVFLKYAKLWERQRGHAARRL